MLNQPWEIICILAIFAGMLLLYHAVMQKLNDEGLDQYDPNEYYRAHSAYMQSRKQMDQVDPHLEEWQ